MLEGFQKGLVAYFDILGFSSVAASEDMVTAAKLVEDTLLAIPNEIRRKVDQKHGGTRCRLDTHSLTFADSILVWHSVPDSEFGEPYHWNFFLSVCSWFMRRMFEEGLPLRGAISAGQYFIKGHSFVGRPIMDCHELSQRTEWAGCAFAVAAQDQLRNIDAGWKTILECWGVPYRVPFKGAAVQMKNSSQFVLKWHHYDVLATNGPMPDIRESVRRAFQAHGKTFSETDRSVIRKVQNTVEYLEYVNTLYFNSNRKMPKRMRKKIQSG